MRRVLLLPKEHGAWGMVFIPLVLGFLVARGFGVPGLLLLIAVAAFFLAREPFMVWWRARRRRHADSAGAGRLLGFWAAVGLVSGAALVFVFSRTWLIAVGAIACAMFVWHAEASMKGKGRTVLAELLAIASSTITAAAAYEAVTGRLDLTAWLLWALSAGYFASSVFYVKMRLGAAHSRDPIPVIRARRACSMYHLVLSLILLALFLTAAIPALAVAAFLPVFLRAWVGAFWLPRTANLKRIGWSEVAYSVVFLVVTAVSL